MVKNSLRPYYVMGGIVALLLVITAEAGVLNNSIYAPFLNQSLVDFQYFQDMVSLIFAPLLVVVMVYASQGSRRAYLLWAGLMVYVAYYYAFYGFGFVYTVYYPFYLALMGLAMYTLIGLLSSVNMEAFRSVIRPNMPVRFIAVVLGMTALFVPIWLSMIVMAIQTQQGQATDLVFVLDLPYLIPACVLAAILIWRRRPFGFLISGPLLFKATTSGLLLTGGELLKMQRGLPPAVDQLAMYLFLAVAGLSGLVLFLRNLDDGRVAKAAKPDMLPSLNRGG